MLLVKTQELDKLQQSKGTCMYITVYNVDMYMYIHPVNVVTCMYIIV